MFISEMKKSDTYNIRLLKEITGGGNVKTVKKRVREMPSAPLESQIQQSCIKWFQLQYRNLWDDGVLFHIANEGIRLGGQGRRLKREGVVKGVADLCLAVPKHGYGALYIEMKRPGCYQSPEQRTWQRNITKHGNKYIVCRSLEEFIVEINRYLAQ